MVSSAQPADTIDLLSDALHEAIGQVIAEERRDWRRERDRMEAQSQAILAQTESTVALLRATVVETRGDLDARVQQRLLETAAQIAERLAELRDGAQGERGLQGERGERGEQGERGDVGQQGEAGTPGTNGAQGERGEQGPKGIDGAIGPQGPAGACGDTGPAGERGLPGDLGPQGPQGERGEIGPAGEAGTPGPPGPTGAPGEAGAPGAAGEAGAPGAPGPAGQPGDKGDQGPAGERGLPGERGVPGERGLPGEPGAAGAAGAPGERGEPGRLPIVHAYEPDSVHYAGDVVAHLGGSWQARKDTGQAPPHRDWIALAVRGTDGATPQVRGTWAADVAYKALDIVAHNGGSFISRRDNPGPCPGDGWQSLTLPGKKGERGLPGDRGDRGERGPPGERGLSPKSWRVDRAAYAARLILSDGSEVVLPLRELFEQFHSEAR